MKLGINLYLWADGMHDGLMPVLEKLKEIGYDGYVAYEMCSYLRGGGSEENLERYARKFLDYMTAF